MADNIYVPGICNIGTIEITRRKKIGWAGLGVTIVILLISIFFKLPALWRLIVFIPVTLSVIGFLQAYMKFCAFFGLRGVLNFSSNVGETNSIQQSEFRTKDRHKALQIIFYSVIIGIIVTAGAYNFS